MRRWLQSLVNTPRGFAADGRRLGLGLAIALEKQRKDAPHEVEQYLREQPEPHKASV
jgi:hypothetical protein